MDKSIVKINSFKKESGIKLSKQLLESDNKPEAIFIANLDITLGTLKAIKDLGLKIPEDMAIIGFDEEVCSVMIDPPLTFIR